MHFAGRYAALGEEKMVSQLQVARRAQTSLKTVSRVINGDPLVSAETRRRVEEIIAELGYQPSQAARMMRSQRSNIIGFLADEVATTNSSVDLVRGAQAVAWERGKQMMLFNIEQGTESHALAEAQLSAFRAEAVIYASVYHRRIAIGPQSLPHVLLNCFDGENRHPAIVPDDFQLGHDLTAEIFRRGYKRPIFLNLSADSVASELRAAGYIAAGAEAGHDLTATVHTAVATPAGSTRPTYLVDQILRREMQGAARPDVIVAGQDAMAVTVYFELTALGLKVGKDIAVASFDNQKPIVDLLQPGLSTMSLPYYEMGRLAMTMAIDAQFGASKTLLPGSFIERNSL